MFLLIIRVNQIPRPRAFYSSSVSKCKNSLQTDVDAMLDFGGRIWLAPMFCPTRPSSLFFAFVTLIDDLMITLYHGVNSPVDAYHRPCT